MVRNLLSQTPERMDRPKVLLLGISYPDVQGQMEKHGFDSDVLVQKEPSVDQAVECVRRGILTEMDARDLARCVATEDECKVDVYSASKEIGAVYREDRHIYGDFNARNFCNNLREAFGDGVQFTQIILDYYWMPTGWLVTRWAKTLFQRTLPNLVKYNMLTYPSTRSKKRRQTHEEGVVLLPFCAHVCKELVGAMSILREYYAVSFVKKDELADHSLWKGTMSIDGETMQTRLGKRLDQEEFYCTFKPKDIYESMEDPHVSKDDVMRVLLAIEDYKNVRMVKLRPLRQHEPPSVMRERLVKPEIGGWKGLNFALADKRENQKKVEQKAALRAQRAAQKEALQAQKAAQRAAAQEKARLAKEKKKATAELAKKRKLATSVQAKPKKKQKKIRNVEEVEDFEAEVSDDEAVEEENEEEEPAEYKDIPDVTYFFPGPTRDLDTYDYPDAEKEQKDVPRCSLLDAPARKLRTTKRSLASAAKIGFQDLDHVQNVGPQYLSFNPRRVPSHKRKLLAANEDDGKGVYVTDLYVKEKANDYRDISLEGACNLFDIRHAASLKGVSRKRCERGQLTCYKIPKQAICDALDNSKPNATDSDESQEDYDTINDAPIFQMAVQACRGQWESVLDAKTVEQIRKRKASIRKYAGTQPQAVDRTILLDAVVRWLAFEQDPCWDPSGELSRIYEKFSEKGRFTKDQSLATQATLIEKEWHRQGKLVKRKSLQQETAGEEVTTLEAQEPDPETFEHARQWLEGKDASAPVQFDSDFQKIAYLLERGDQQSEEDRAKELALSYEIACNITNVATNDVKAAADPPAESASPKRTQDSPVRGTDRAAKAKESKAKLGESTPPQKRQGETTLSEENDPPIAKKVESDNGTRTVDRLASIAASELESAHENTTEAICENLGRQGGGPLNRTWNQDDAADKTATESGEGTMHLFHPSFESTPAAVASTTPKKTKKAPRKKSPQKKTRKAPQTKLGKKKATPNKSASSTAQQSRQQVEASLLSVLASAAEEKDKDPREIESTAPAKTPEASETEAMERKRKEAQEHKKVALAATCDDLATKYIERKQKETKEKECALARKIAIEFIERKRKQSEENVAIGTDIASQKQTEPHRENAARTMSPEVGKTKARNGKRKESHEKHSTLGTPKVAVRETKPIKRNRNTAQGQEMIAHLRTPVASGMKKRESEERAFNSHTKAHIAAGTKSSEEKRKKTAEAIVQNTGPKVKRSEKVGIQDSLYRLNATSAEARDKKARFLPLDSLGACSAVATQMKGPNLGFKSSKSKNKSMIAEKNLQVRKSHEKTPVPRKGKAKPTILARDRFSQDGSFKATPAKKQVKHTPPTDDRKRTPVGRSQRINTMPMLASLPRPRGETHAMDDALTRMYRQRFSQDRLHQLHSILNSLSAPSGNASPRISRLGQSFGHEDSLQRRAVLIEMAANRLQSAFGDDWGNRLGNDDSVTSFMRTIETRVRDEAQELFRHLQRVQANSAQCVSPSPPTGSPNWRRADALSILINHPSSPIAAVGQSSPITSVGQTSPIRFGQGRVPGREFRYF